MTINEKACASDNNWNQCLSLFDVAETGVVLYAVQQQQMTLNGYARLLHGYSADEDITRYYHDYCDVWEVMDLSNRPLSYWELPLERALRGEAVVATVLKIVAKRTGVTRVCSQTVKAFYEGENTLTHLLLFMKDITYVIKMEEIADEKSLFLNEAFESMTEALFITNNKGEILKYNDAWLSFTRFKDGEEFIRKTEEYPNLFEVYYLNGEMVPLQEWAVFRALRGERVKNAEFRLRRSDTGEEWIGNYNFSPIQKDNITIGAVVVCADITQQKQQAQALKYITEHDVGTGLANRQLLLELLADACAPSRKHLRQAVVMVHINKMNLLLRTYGYPYAEGLVKEFGAGIKALCPNTCALFRVATDRLALYVRTYEAPHELVNICEGILGLFEQKLSRSYVQMGIVELSGSDTEPEVILKHATIAAAGSSPDYRYTFYSQDMVLKLQRRETIIRELNGERSGDTQGKLFVEYQPIVHAASKMVSGFEALARFNSEAFGPIPPVEFINIAEEEHIIVALGKKIIILALEFLKELQNKGCGHLRLNLNLSAIQLLREDFIPEFKQMIKERAVLPQNIIIEITESVFVNNIADINEKLSILSDLGIGAAIDDFGTGYSSLARESEMNVDCLKIDKYFIDSLRDGNEARQITADIISMAHKMGHCVVAEGVEYPEQERYLVAHQCDLLQGYLYSKPISTLRALALAEAERLG